MELLLPIYIITCALLATLVGYDRYIGFWGSFLVSLVFTPFVGVPFSYCFKMLPKACCMKDFKDFTIGISYHYKIKQYNGKPYFLVKHATNHLFTEEAFNAHFAKIVDTPPNADEAKPLLGLPRNRFN